MSHVPLVFDSQTRGSTRAANAISRERARSLEFSRDKVIRSAHIGAVAALDLDAVEHRYLLAGAADASIAVYDTQQASRPEALEAQEAARGAAGALASATTNAPALRQSAQAAAAAAAGGGEGHGEHAALFAITKQAAQAHRFSVSAVAWYPVDSGLFVSGGYDGEVKVWDTNTQHVVTSFSLNSRVSAAAMSAAASSHCLVAVGSRDTQVMLCDIMSGGFTHTLSGHRASVWALHWSPSNEWQLATGGCDGQLRLWDIRRAGPLHIFDEHDTQQQHEERRRQQQQQQQQQDRGQQDVQQPAIGQDGSGSGTQRQNGQRRLQRSSSGQGGSRGSRRSDVGGGGSGSSEHMFLPERVTKYSTAHAGSITGVVPTPDGLHWLSAGTDDRVRLWDALTHALVHYPGAFNRANRARQLAVSGDSSLLFHPSGSVVQVFDIASGRLVHTLGGGHFDTVNCCKWNASAEELYSGSSDCNIVVWAPPPEPISAEREAWQRDSDGDDWTD